MTMQGSHAANELTAECPGWRCRIDQVMQRTMTIGPDDSLDEAASLMAAHGMQALPVTDTQQRLLGMITTTAILRAACRPQQPPGQREPTAPVARTPGEALTPAAMSRALALAAALTEGTDDQSEIARALVHACSELSRLEALRAWADRYVHVRQDEPLHGALLQAVEQTISERGPRQPLPL